MYNQSYDDTFNVSLEINGTIYDDIADTKSSHPSCKTRFNENGIYDLTETPYPGIPQTWKELHPADYIKLCVYVIIIIGGVLGNISVILTVALNRSMRTAINIYVSNLAAADALICIICMVPHEVGVATSYDVYVLGEFMCKFNPFTQMTCLTCSVLTLCAISCDRYMAVMFPFRSRITKRRTALFLTVIWILSILVSLPFLFFKKHYIVQWKNFEERKCLEEWPSYTKLDESTGTCETHQLIKIPYYVTVSLTLFFIPFVIMVLAYSLILWKMTTSNVPGDNNAGNAHIHSRSKKKVTKMVFFVLIAFIICWTPFQVVVLYSALGHDAKRDGQMPSNFFEFAWFAYFIAYANSFINPIIYGGFNKSYRDGFCLMFQCANQRRSFGRQSSGINRSPFRKLHFMHSLRSISSTLSSLRSRFEQK